MVQKLRIQATSSTWKSRKYSTYKGKAGNIPPNRISRSFETHIPHQKRAIDTSEIKYYSLLYYSYEELKEAMDNYIKYYNEKRMKEKPGRMSTAEYRINFLIA